MIVAKTRRMILLGASGLAATSLVGCATGSPVETSSLDSGDLRYRKMGDGAPPIVLVSGLGDDLSAWDPVFEPLSKLRQTFAYSRYGYGGSDWTDRPRDAVTISDELASLVSSAGLASPMILVGHSLGGVYAQVFARRFPERVAGMVLVDTAVPGQTAHIRRTMPAAVKAIQLAMLAGPAMTRREFEAAELSESQIQSSPPYRSGRVVVLAAGRDPASPAAYAQFRRDGMRALADSYGGDYLEIDCGHYIQREQPEAVLEAVASVLA